ncbi:DUF6680 family protein [Novosphingobium sp. JCM 18896]|uniref:DUF6680 family protein n=1 Tax=Novosphingobium sp. JCM 18896 TaxID=2989731 RepID=UPI00222292F3|nr:DUF6680 family protein [Novosphingobium sp. JCM 18896]MCW1431513.1 hypothetical protein [Novosphingobium sp. JCM 18896]
MTLNEWLTLAGVVVSPIFAVCIILWIEGRRRDREGKMVVVRALMTTRHLPADPNYSGAINLLRVEFAHCRPVMEAFKEYHRNIRREQPSTPEGANLHNQDVLAAQTKLLSAALNAVGIKASEADLAVEAYAANGFILRDNIYLASLKAQDRIAVALERSVMLNEQMLSGEDRAKNA